MTAFLVIKAIQTPRTCVIFSKGCYKELLAIFRAVSFFFLQFLLIFYVAVIRGSNEFEDFQSHRGVAVMQCHKICQIFLL
jgi:hypothetical protein